MGSKYNPICQYCNEHSQLVDGSKIYPHREDLKDLNFYFCEQCDAYVGCHKGTTNPLGCLANAELRKWKSLAHKVFDVQWRDGRVTRKHAYKVLSEQLNIPSDQCHIGMFSVAQCKQVYVLYKEKQ